MGDLTTGTARHVAGGACLTPTPCPHRVKSDDPKDGKCYNEKCINKSLYENEQ